MYRYVQFKCDSKIGTYRYFKNFWIFFIKKHIWKREMEPFVTIGGAGAGTAWKSAGFAAQNNKK
jgi:hypothetical protein